MPRRNRPTELEPRLFQRALLDNTTSIEARCDYLRSLRQTSEDQSAFIDRSLLLTIERYRTRLAKAGEVHEQLEEVYQNLEAAFRELTAPPLYPATFVEHREFGEKRTALVHCNNSFRYVSLSDEFNFDGIGTGAPVLLSGDLNMLIGQLDGRPLEIGETATFDRYTDDGRLVLSHRDGTYVANASAALDDVLLKSGDEVRWSPSSWIAYEKIERSNGDRLIMEEVPEETFDDIGGLDSQIRKLKKLVLLHHRHRVLAGEYRVPPQRAALLEGPPGTGKTLLAKALVNFVGELSPSGRARFMNIKFSDLSSMWYGETEKNIEKVFRIASDAAAADPQVPVVMFFDEVDAIAAARGESIHHIDDRVVDALAIALDGLQSRGNMLVLAATNRKDIMDEALIRPGRFGSAPIDVGRPNRTAAHAILSKYLRDDMPYAAGNEKGELLDTALSRLYSPNGDGDVASITLRDGTRRPVRIRELLSGAVLAKLARAAAERACIREIETGDRGIRVSDVLDAVADEVATIARMLTPANCRRYLDDLPQDVDVVRVEQTQRVPKVVHRFAAYS